MVGELFEVECVICGGKEFFLSKVTGFVCDDCMEKKRAENVNDL